MTDTEYAVLDSPYKEVLDREINRLYESSKHSADEDHRRGVKDALYFAVQKRMSERMYDGDEQEYLAGLASDISRAKYEFSEVCYTNDSASSTFSALNAIVLGLMR